ncbi:MAG: MBL fold metallo-hydrolase [Actinomycetes bacterium]
MRLTVVGCSGSFPSADSPASCYLVEADGCRVLVDLGNGALGAAARHVSIYDVQAVLISHLHPDHFFDLCSLYVARRYHPDGRLDRIPVYGPKGIADRLALAYGLDPAPGMQEEFDFHEWEDGAAYDVGPLRVTVARVVHPIEAFAMRVEHGGRSLTYSGDTGVSDALVELALETDLLLCEAGFHEGRDNPPGLHLTGREAAEHATRAAARRLVLTHIPPWNDPMRAVAEAGPAFGGSIEVARPGATYEL